MTRIVRVAILPSLSFSCSRAWGCYQFQVGAGFSPLPMCSTNGVPVFPVLSGLIIHCNDCSLHSRLQKSHVRTHEKALHLPVSSVSQATNTGNSSCLRLSSVFRTVPRIRFETACPSWYRVDIPPSECCRDGK